MSGRKSGRTSSAEALNGLPAPRSLSLSLSFAYLGALAPISACTRARQCVLFLPLPPPPSLTRSDRSDVKMSRRDSSPNPLSQPSPNLAPIPSNPTPSSRLDPAAAPFVPVVEPPPFVRRRLRAVYPSSSSSSAPPPQERSIDPDILAFLVGQSTVSQNLMSGHEAKLKGIEDQAVDELCLFLLGGEAGRGEEQNGRWYDGPRVVPRRSIVVFVGDDFGTGKGGQGWHGMECGNSIVREAERKLRDRGYSDVHFMRTPESETRRFCPWPGCTDSGGHQNRCVCFSLPRLPLVALLPLRRFSLCLSSPFRKQLLIHFPSSRLQTLSPSPIQQDSRAPTP